MVFVLNKENTIANHFLAELRDQDIQQDRLRFRRNLERLGEVLAYEFSKVLNYESEEILTPLGSVYTPLAKEDLVVMTILRAGLPFYQGFMNFFDFADSGFIGAFRKEADNQREISIDLGYIASGSLDGKTLVLLDPMIATGKSLIEAIDHLSGHGSPAHIHIMSVISAPEGIEYLQGHLKTPHTIWTVSLDEKLNDQAYIVPGLGDAGDLAFGQKL